MIKFAMHHHLSPLLFFLFAYILPLGYRPMVTPDEFRYGEIPREMILRENYVTPTLMQLRYFEKPVLGYQLTAASFKIFGQNAFALRFPAALATGLTALLLALYIRRATGDDRMAAVGAQLFLACGLVYGIGTFAVLDAPTSLFMVGTMTAFFPAVITKRWGGPKLLFLLLTGIFAGLGFLTKGFIAFAVPGVAILAFLLWEKRWKELFLLPWIPLAAALAVAAPWALAIHRAEPDFWRYFTIIEHWQRFVGDNPDAGQHPEPFWFFLPVLILGCLPAGLLAPIACAGFRGKLTELRGTPFFRYTLCMLIFPFLFFSASSGKLATYVLPCFAPLAVLGAIGIANYFRLGGEYPFFRKFSLILGIILLALAPLGVAGGLLLPRFAANALWLPHPAAVIAAGSAIALWGAMLLAATRRSWKFQLAAFFAGMVPLVIAGELAIPESAFGDKTPEKALRALRQYLPADAIVVAHRSMTHASAWCWDRPDVKIFAAVGELEYGLGYPDAAGRFLSLPDYNQLLRQSSRPAVVFIGRAKDHDCREPGSPAPDAVYTLREVRMLVYSSRTPENRGK